MTAYYNEFNPKAAAMLRQLIKDGLIAAGDVDERSILEVKADELKGYTQCHFFAGIGGWSVALRLANWDDTRPVWTGSCPCQPFSAAGKQKGKNDERHLWPVWFRLIRECRPSIIFGEQVASAITHGWWDDVADDLEGENYACGVAVLPACSVGKPHKRDRLWFVGNAELHGCDDGSQRGSVGTGENQGWLLQSERPSSPEYVADTNLTLSKREWQSIGFREAYAQHINDLSWITCPDGKQRAVEPRIRLLAHGIQHRAPILHAFGNAIVPQVAAEFIKATQN